ncbi:MAG: carbohydrate ABC transporter permease [Bacillota bacterium]
MTVISKEAFNSYKKQNYLMFILFLLPAALLYIGLFIYPSIKAFYISLFDWNGFTTTMNYIGLRNFSELFSDAHFWNVVMKNTLFIIFLGGFLVFFHSFILSGVLATEIKGRKFFRALLFFPYIINPVAVAILWSFIYNKKWGLLNNILTALGFHAVPTWTNPEVLFWAILVALTWMYTGFYCIILLAALDRVPQGLIESANLDGANEFQIFFKVKIPLIWDVLVTALVFWGITAIKEFALLFTWNGGIDVPPDGATNLAVQMYVTAFGRRVNIFRMGYSTAMGVIMFLLVAVLVLSISRIFKRDTVEY